MARVSTLAPLAPPRPLALTFLRLLTLLTSVTGLIPLPVVESEDPGLHSDGLARVRRFRAPSQAPQGRLDAEAVQGIRQPPGGPHRPLAAPSEDVLGGGVGGGHSGEFLRYDNGTVQRFPSCSQACDECFNDHYQGCLAFCKVGCQDYCLEKLPRPACESKQEWYAQVGHVFQALKSEARMCQATGFNGCPDQPTVAPAPMPFQPFVAKTSGGNVPGRLRRADTGHGLSATQDRGGEPAMLAKAEGSEAAVASPVDGSGLTAPERPRVAVAATFQRGSGAA
mmetsp:Transcript_1977/g.4523  ORF Transcript_1977/g.4523 Transcript_1977/m.4523 type:complete len:281 (+) Transcript_1977:145-987(+)